MWQHSERLRDPLGGEAEGPGIRVAGLKLALREVDGPAIDATRRAGLEASELEAEGREAVTQSFGRLITGPAAAGLRLAGVHDRFEESARRQDHGLGTIERVAGGADADDSAGSVVEDDRLDCFLAQRQVVGLLDAVLERELVKLLIRLGPRRMHGRALRLVQHAELQACDVGDAAHLAAEGVDLADDLPLGDAADRGIAAHRADGVGAHREESGSRPIRAAARAASVPAWPGAATTITSVVENQGRHTCHPTVDRGGELPGLPSSLATEIEIADRTRRAKRLGRQSQEARRHDRVLALRIIGGKSSCAMPTALRGHVSDLRLTFDDG